jgi:hypothetical protein
VDARAQLNLSKRLSAWSDSQKDLSLKKVCVESARAPRSLFQIKFQSSVLFSFQICFVWLARTRSALSALCVSFLKYIRRLCSRECRNIWSGLNLQLVLRGACSGRLFLLFALAPLWEASEPLWNLQRCGEWSRKLLFCSANNCRKLFCRCSQLCLDTHLCLFRRQKEQFIFSVKFAQLTGRPFIFGAGEIFPRFWFLEEKILLYVRKRQKHLEILKVLKPFSDQQNKKLETSSKGFYYTNRILLFMRTV